MTPPRPASAITAMWAWDNPVDPAQDLSGRGYAPAAADRLAAFAQAGGLRDVHLAVPGGSPEDGPVRAWLRDAVAALHDGGVRVGAVTDVPGATPHWVRTVTALAPFDRLQVVVLPWVVRGSGDRGEVGRSLVSRLGAVSQAAAGAGAGVDGSGSGVAGSGSGVDDAGSGVDGSGSGVDDAGWGVDDAGPAVGRAVPVDACVPWWFATEPFDGGRTLLDAVLDAVDRVALAAPAARAEGPDGVLDLAGPAIEALRAAGRSFTIGVQADTPDAAGGAEHTFYDEGPVALIRECGLVSAHLADVPGFEGVAIKSHRSWRGLLGV